MPTTNQPETLPLLDRESFLKSGNGRRFTVGVIPGLGRVRIRSLKESERSEFEAEAFDDGGEFDHDALTTAKRRLVILCVVDANGEPLLNFDDLDALGEKDGAIFNALYKECAKHTGINESDLAALVGNSKATPAADSR